ncbi:MAG: MFS transporter [Anaerolineae bacterium]
MASTSEVYEDYIQEHQTWNFVVNSLDLTFYNLAVSFIFGATVLSLYASYLTASAVLIGLLPAIQSVGYFLPQLLTARRAGWLARKKPLVQKISVFERLPYLVVALSILLWPKAPSWFSYSLLALCLAVATGSGGLASPAWKSMLAKVIPVERRGRLFGLSRALGGLLGVGGAAYARHVLDAYPYPTSFGICFLLCFCFQALSWLCLSLNREPAREPTKPEESATSYWRRLPGVLGDNPNYARFLVGRSLVIMSTMATTFYVIYGRAAYDITDAFTANLTMAALISQTVSNPLLGWLADHRGNIWVMEVSTLAGGMGLLMALFSSSATWLYGVFMLANAATTGMALAGMSITMEFGDAEEMPIFSALANTITAIPILLAPILGGWIVDVAGFWTLFIAGLSFAVAGCAVMHWCVREPREVECEDPKDARSCVYT